MENKREIGFYWVKENFEFYDWTIAYWDSSQERWKTIYSSWLFQDKDFEEIDEKRIEKGIFVMNVNQDLIEF